MHVSFTPPANEVHVWKVPQDGLLDQAHGLAQWLSADERARATRFRSPHDRDRFIVSKAMLRSVLGRYLNIAPEQVSFRYGEHGKPDLAPGQTTEDLTFNLTHAGGIALCVVALGRRVGIDLERKRGGLPLQQIAGQFFSPMELGQWETLPAAERDEAFFRLWTRKEAFIKALGSGLAAPLHAIHVALEPGEPAAVLSVPPGEDARRWLLTDLSVEPGYAAALCIEGHDCSIRYRVWP